MIMDGECAPLIPNLVRNHFSYMATLNQMSDKKPAVLNKAISRFKALAVRMRSRFRSRLADFR